MSVNLSKGEYELLVKAIEGMSQKVDKIYEKINYMDKKTVALEEWRKHRDSQSEAKSKDYQMLKARVTVLENYRWFLVGVSIAISTLAAIVSRYVFVDMGQ